MRNLFNRRGMMELSRRERATVRAALRSWQREVMNMVDDKRGEVRVSVNSEEVNPLNEEEINDLRDRLNAE
jgi:hypothetical protein